MVAEPTFKPYVAPVRRQAGPRPAPKAPAGTITPVTRLPAGEGLVKSSVPEGPPVRSLPIKWRPQLSKPEAQARDLTIRIVEARTAGELLKIVDKYMEDKYFNEIHLAVAFTKLARVRVDEETLKSKVVIRMVRMFKDLLKAESLGPRSFATVFWALGQLGELPGLTDERSREMLINGLVYQSLQFGPQETATCILAVTRIELTPRELRKAMRPMLQSAMKFRDAFNANQMANILQAGGKLANSSMLLPLFRALEPHVEAAAKNMDGQHLSTVLHSMVTLKREGRELRRCGEDIVAKLIPAVLRNASSLKPIELSNIIWACGNMNFTTATNAAPRVANLALRKIREMTPQQIANSCWGLALCQAAPKDFLGEVAQELSREAFKWPRRSRAFDLPQIALAYAKLRQPNVDLLRSVARTCETMLLDVKDWGICALAWTFERLDDRKLFQDFLFRVYSEVKRRRLTVQDIKRSVAGPAGWKRDPPPVMKLLRR